MNYNQLLKIVFDLSPETQGRIILTIIIIFSLALFRKITLTIALKRAEQYHIRYRWRKISAYTAFILGILIIGRIWFKEFESLATFLGLVSAGIAIALKDPLTNMAGWIFLIWKKPFAIGDRIQVAKYSGDVIDIGVFQFTIMEIGNWVDADQITGRLIHLPNAIVFQEAQANYTRGIEFIWDEISVIISFESKWKKAREILQNIVVEHTANFNVSANEKIKNATQNFMISNLQLIPNTYVKVVENGVCLTIRYLCDPRNRRGRNNAIWQDILEQFSENQEINFAYPTQRFYSRYLEGNGLSDPEKDN